MGHATKFAPAERMPRAVIDEQARVVRSFENLQQLLQGVPYISLILNYQRQVVFFNRALLGALNIDSPQKIFGKRPGEVVNCIYSNHEPGGCGTSEHCSVCGAVDAILRSQRDNETVSLECRIATRQDGVLVPLDLLVASTPLQIHGDHYSLVTLTDVSDTKRRRSMERIFFHDIINIAGSLKGYFDLLSHEIDVDQLTEMLPLLQDSLKQLMGEIQAQRSLTLAENGELPVEIRDLRCREVVEAVADTYRRNEVARGRTLEVEPGCARARLRADATLLRRVLGNLTKNALEASAEGDTVRLGCDLDDDRVRFWVHNRQYMPPELQLQIFQRSFSTKGKSRGLGTYSVRLIAERYMEGEVGFTSNEEAGTTFWVALPGAPAED